MKTSIVLLILLSFLAMNSVYSHGRDRFKKSRGSMPASMHNENNIKDMDRIREHMNEIQVFISEAKKTEDMEKRQALMRKHMDGMKSAFGEMHSMMEDDMRDGHSNNKLKDMDMEQRQGLMENRMNIMQMILEQMIDRESLLTDK